MEQQEFLHRLSSYENMSEMLKVYSYEEILNAAADLIRIAPDELERYPMGGIFQGQDKRRLPVHPAGYAKKHPLLRLAVFPFGG